MAKKMAPVAVVVPVYNRRLKLIKTLECVASQSSLPIRVIVVDDGSTDGTSEAAKEWLTQYAPFEWMVIEQANAGAAAARNVGFVHVADLPFVCFLDSDDLWPEDFIEQGLEAFQGREDAVAAIADRVKEISGKEKRQDDLRSVALNPLLWVICNTGGILSCTMIRSAAARSAGLFVPGMIVSEDTDFLLRLFSLGGAVHSKAAAVHAIKKAPLEPAEAPNLSDSSPHLKTLWAQHLTTAISKLPTPLVEEHGEAIRTAAARRWAVAGFANKRAGNYKVAVSCVLKSICWDPDWRRRLTMLLSFILGQRKLVNFSTPSRQLSSPSNR